MKKPYQKLKAGLKKRMHLFVAMLLTFLIVAGYLSQNIFHTILPGEAGVLWRRFAGGTRVDYIYSEGMHLIWPWDKFYIYNVRIQQMAPELDVLTNTGLEIHLYLSIRYAPKYKLLGLLHRAIGPDYANKVIIPEIESVLREVIGTMEAEKAYTTGRKVIIEAINLAIERVAQRYIDVDSVLIKRIELPPSVAEAIRYKIKQKQLVEAHQFIVEREKKEAERKVIEGEGIRDQLNVIASALPEGEVLQWIGIRATLELSKSENSKVVVIGGEKGLPIIGTVPMAQHPLPDSLVPDTRDNDPVRDLLNMENPSDTGGQP